MGVGPSIPRELTDQRFWLFQENAILPAPVFKTAEIKKAPDFSVKKVTIILKSKENRNDRRRKNRCFPEPTLNLQRGGFIVKPETEEGLLPVELDGQRLCRALDSGAVSTVSSCSTAGVHNCRGDAGKCDADGSDAFALTSKPAHQQQRGAHSRSAPLR